MTEGPSESFVIVVMAVIVYLTRVGGYMLGLQFRHVGRLRPVLEILPGCAFMAILVPAVRLGSFFDVVALICVVAIMWRTNNVAIATLVGLVILLFGPEYFSPVSLTQLSTREFMQLFG